jgi:hypothetical protein
LPGIRKYVWQQDGRVAGIGTYTYSLAAETDCRIRQKHQLIGVCGLEMRRFWIYCGKIPSYKYTLYFENSEVSPLYGPEALIIQFLPEISQLTLCCSFPPPNFQNCTRSENWRHSSVLIKRRNVRVLKLLYLVST